MAKRPYSKQVGVKPTLSSSRISVDTGVTNTSAASLRPDELIETQLCKLRDMSGWFSIPFLARCSADVQVDELQSLRKRAEEKSRSGCAPLS